MEKDWTILDKDCGIVLIDILKNDSFFYSFNNITSKRLPIRESFVLGEYMNNYNRKTWELKAKVIKKRDGFMTEGTRWEVHTLVRLGVGAGM